MQQTLTENIERQCVRCGETFPVDTSKCAWWSQKYCSETCRKVDQNAKRCQKAKMAKAGDFCRVKKCEWCDEPFVVDYEHRGQRFCPRPKTCAYDFQRGEAPAQKGALYEGVQGTYRMPEKTRAKVSDSLRDGFRRGRKPTILKHWRHLYQSAGREVLMRSKSEVLFAEQLDSKGIEWQYEPKKFDLGWTTYTPDFYLPAFNRWIEVKGFWEEGSSSQKKFIEFRGNYTASVVWAQDILKFAKYEAKAS